MCPNYNQFCRILPDNNGDAPVFVALSLMLNRLSHGHVRFPKESFQLEDLLSPLL